MKPYLSIIIPAYNESKRIGATLDSINDFVARQSFQCEVIVVNDGSTDTTSDVVNTKIHSIPRTRLISSPVNQGKGASVKKGMHAAQGEFRVFMDADNSTSIEEAGKLLPYTKQGYDVVIGSRYINGSEIQIGQKAFRKSLAKIFRSIAHILVPLSVTDTQNGFKLFSKKAAEDLFPLIQSRRYCFDIELLLYAQELGFRIVEVPVVWRNDPKSNIKIRHMFLMLFDLLQLYGKRLVRTADKIR